MGLIYLSARAQPLARSLAASRVGTAPSIAFKRTPLVAAGYRAQQQQVQIAQLSTSAPRLQEPPIKPEPGTRTELPNGDHVVAPKVCAYLEGRDRAVKDWRRRDLPMPHARRTRTQ